MSNLRDSREERHGKFRARDFSATFSGYVKIYLGDEKLVRRTSPAPWWVFDDIEIEKQVRAVFGRMESSLIESIYNVTPQQWYNWQHRQEIKVYSRWYFRAKRGKFSLDRAKRRENKNIRRREQELENKRLSDPEKKKQRAEWRKKYRQQRKSMGLPSI